MLIYLSIFVKSYILYCRVLYQIIQVFTSFVKLFKLSDIHFKELSKLWQFILIPFWVYILMLPYSIVIFGNFSVYHPLSIIWTSLFTLFYPLSILLHIINQGDLLDSVLNFLLSLNTSDIKISLDWKWLILYINLSIASIYKKSFSYLLLSFGLSVLIYSIYNVT